MLFLSSRSAFWFKEQPFLDQEENAMVRPRTRRSATFRKTFLLQKPTGELAPRVQAVGPEQRYNAEFHIRFDASREHV